MSDLNNTTRENEQFSSIILNLTDVGVQAALEAHNNGIKIELEKIKYSSDNFASVPLDPITELNNIIAETFIAGGGVSEDGRTLRLFSILSLQHEVTVQSLGIYTKEGILFAVASTPTGSLFKVYGGVSFIASFGMAISQAAANGVTVLVDQESTSAIKLLAEHEKAANPHPQYDQIMHDLEGNVFDIAVWADEVERQIRELEERNKQLQDDLQNAITISNKQSRIIKAGIIGADEIEGWHTVKVEKETPNSEEIDLKNNKYTIFFNHESKIDASRQLVINKDSFEVYLSRYGVSANATLKTHYIVVRTLL